MSNKTIFDLVVGFMSVNFNDETFVVPEPNDKIVDNICVNETALVALGGEDEYNNLQSKGKKKRWLTEQRTIFKEQMEQYTDLLVKEDLETEEEKDFMSAMAGNLLYLAQLTGQVSCAPEEAETYADLLAHVQSELGMEEVTSEEDAPDETPSAENSQEDVQDDVQEDDDTPDTEQPLPDGVDEEPEVEIEEDAQTAPATNLPAQPIGSDLSTEIEFVSNIIATTKVVDESLMKAIETAAQMQAGYQSMIENLLTAWKANKATTAVVEGKVDRLTALAESIKQSQIPEEVEA